MAGSWQWRTLGDVATIVAGQSPAGSEIGARGRWPFFQGAKDFGDRFPTPRTFCDSPPRMAERGSLLVSVRAPVGRINRCNSRCGIGRGVMAVSGQSDIETDFLEYVLRSVGQRWQVIESSGSVFANLARGDLEGLSIPVPPLPEQRAIARILGALDDKIELNRQMNETLEAIARALFKSWFIDFDPVHAKAEGRDPGLPADIAALFPDSFQDSELGEIPKGWTAGKFGNIVSQRTERLRYRSAVILSAMAAGELLKSDEHFTKRVYSQDIGKYLTVEQWDFAYNPSRVNIGSIGMWKEPRLGGVSPVYVVFCPQAAYRWFVEFSLRQPGTKQWINTLASGSVRQSLSYADFASLPCVIPPETIIARFDEAWASLRAGTLLRSDESHVLAELRDALLPKLLSGELEPSLLVGLDEGNGRRRQDAT